MQSIESITQAQGSATQGPTARADEVAARARADWKSWTGRVITGVVLLFMAFDGAGKIFTEQHVVTAMSELGWPADLTVGLGVVILACTALHAIPRTSVLGAILLTGFLGGATAAKVRLESGSYLFSVAMGVLVWAGLFLRDARVRALLPVVRREAPRTTARP